MFLVVKAVYGLKSASFSFRSCMAEKLTEMGFQSTMADPDVRLRAATKGDGGQYYEYVLMYVDDILAMTCDAKSTLEDVQRTFRLKNNKFELPEFNLGAKLQEKSINRLSCWTITSQDSIKAAVRNVEKAIRGTRWHLPTSNINTPMNGNYAPEVDVTAELNDKGVTFF